MLTTAVARSSSGGVAIRYVLPVLQMTSCLHTVAYLGFCEGGQSQRREVECGEGVPSPLKKGSEGGGCAPSPEIFRFFLVQCVQKIFVFRPKGGHRPVAP